MAEILKIIDLIVGNPTFLNLFAPILADLLHALANQISKDPSAIKTVIDTLKS